MHDHWDSNNPDVCELLNFTNVDSLELICSHYELEVTFKEKDVLKEKIEKASLLVLDEKPTVVIDPNPDPLTSKTKIPKANDNKSNHKKLKNVPKNKQKIKDDKSNPKKSRTSQRKGFSLKRLFSKLAQ